MSVALLTTQELGCFVAICHKHLDAGPVPHLCELTAWASSGNCGAFSAQYGEPNEPCTTEDIEAAVLDYLAERRDMVADHFGPIWYNMIANNGDTFIAPGVEIRQDSLDMSDLHDLEKRAHAWQEGQQRTQQRAEEDVEAYNDIGQLPVLSATAIEAARIAAGADRIIYAEFRVNESDMQTDYFGGRTSRTVVIGFGKGKRENFKQLRKAAATFEPTAHMGPGRDIWTPRVVVRDNIEGTTYWKGSYSHWHHDIEQEATFATEAEAVAYTTEQGEPHAIGFDGVTGHFEWDIEHESYENRENYSMGGGNYLGACRYGGWQVSSRTHVPDDGCEYCGEPISKTTEPEPTAPEPTEATTTQAATIQKHHHTKRDVDFWLIPTGDMDRDTFDAKRSECKAAGGWYSRKWGKCPGGFAFDTEADASAFAAEHFDATAPETDATPETTEEETPETTDAVRRVIEITGEEEIEIRSGDHVLYVEPLYDSQGEPAGFSVAR